MRQNYRIGCCLLILATCIFASETSKSKSRSDGKNIDNTNEHPPKTQHGKKQLDDETELDSVFDLEYFRDKELPILPPIILLDYVNGTDEGLLNKTDQNEEKSKRTIDDSLGLGFNSNNLFSGKHNYYFPAGKAGTAVSIEESISPFEPKTVTEVVKPITEKTDATRDDNDKEQKYLFEALPNPLPLQNREPIPIYPPYPVFGQRTKLQKTVTSDFEKRPPTKVYSDPYFTPAPNTDGYNKMPNPYTSAKSAGYSSMSDFANLPNVNHYVRPMTSSYLSNYVNGKYQSNSQKTIVDPMPDSHTSSKNNLDINLEDYPKFTIENGVRYEHKILWKYPDGKISETPPASYVNSYPENIDQQKFNSPATIGGFRPSLPLQSRPMTPPQNYNPYNTRTQNNIYSPKPIQFPDNNEQPNVKQNSDASRFISPPSTGSSYGSDYETIRPYMIKQEQHSLRYTPKFNNPSTAVSYNIQLNKYANHHPSVKYSDNGIKTDYIYNQGNTQNENLFLSNGQINKNVLAKYTPEAQNYLVRVFSGKRVPTSDYNNEEPEKYGNTDFSNLLNYNPSISQYIKNPSSILKAQPTFIQAGSSLIPVIILRVDGAPPIQTKKKPNINLKSLLRQYLTQYANSVSKVSQNSNYDLGSAINNDESSVHQSNPVEDLKHLTDTLESLRQHGHQDPDFIAGSYSHNNAQQSYAVQRQYNNQAVQNHATDYSKVNSEQEINKPQKIKSVQIIEDPRYTSYKIKNNKKK